MTNLHVVLLNPEIAGNTGNIIRLCANTGSQLHLVEPLGFTLDDARLRRAGLDYHEFADVRTHSNLRECMAALGSPRTYAFSARATTTFDVPQYQTNDALLFGSESAGLPSAVTETFDNDRLVRIPVRAQTRSLNLSNAVAIAVYEGLRQLSYPTS